MTQNLVEVIEQVAREKNIKVEFLLEMLEQALSAAFRKHLHTHQTVRVKINLGNGAIESFINKKVVEKVASPETEMSLSAAKKVNPEVNPGEEIEMPLEVQDFGRIAAQTARQVIMQRFKETEREQLYEEFKPKEGELMTGMVRRFLPHAITVDLGKVEAILPQREQVRKEKYQVGMRLKVYVVSVNQSSRGPEILVSRTHPQLVKKLFSMEVPEIQEGLVEIKQIVREPGERSKILVISHKEKVDPVGSCVGVKGSRIRPIIEELNGEKIDVIPYNEDPAGFIARAMSPAKVTEVQILDKEKRRALVIVEHDQLSLAIGWGGHNVKLTARLTGWRIDVRTRAQVEQERQDKLATLVKVLSRISGVGEKTAEIIFNSGFTTPEQIIQSSLDDLTKVEGIGPAKAKKIKTNLEKIMKEQQESQQEPPASQKKEDDEEKDGRKEEEDNSQN